MLVGYDWIGQIHLVKRIIQSGLSYQSGFFLPEVTVKSACSFPAEQTFVSRFISLLFWFALFGAWLASRGASQEEFSFYSGASVPYLVPSWCHLCQPVGLSVGAIPYICHSGEWGGYFRAISEAPPTAMILKHWDGWGYSPHATGLSDLVVAYVMDLLKAPVYEAMLQKNATRKQQAKEVALIEIPQWSDKILDNRFMTHFAHVTYSVPPKSIMARPDCYPLN